MNEVKTIVGNIKKGIIAPIYFLMGEEPYFIDIVSDYIEDHVLQEDQKGFEAIVVLFVTTLKELKLWMRKEMTSHQKNYVRYNVKKVCMGVV